MKKYRPVLECANCLRKTKDCNCSSKLTLVIAECGNCKNCLDEEWSYCPFCGYEVDYESEEQL